MAVLFVVYMPNEDREDSEDGEPLSPTALILPEVATVNGSSKVLFSDDDGGGGGGGVGGEKGDAVPKISILSDDEDEFSPKKPLLSNGGDQTSSTSNEKPVDDDTHQSLLTLDKSIPRQSSDNVLTKPENTESGIEAVSDNVVYKGNKVRFQVTKLDTPEREIEKVKQPVGEVVSSVVEPVVESNDEKKQSLIPAEEADVVMERLTLKEVVTQLCLVVCKCLHHMAPSHLFVMCVSCYLSSICVTASDAGMHQMQVCIRCVPASDACVDPALRP